MILLAYLESLLNWVDLLIAVIVYMHKLLEIFVLMYLQVEVLLKHL